MDIIRAVFKMAEEGDRILMLFPDNYSFLAVMQYIEKNYGNLFWILWTDVSIERINHFGKKYSFPLSGDAIAIYAQKKCNYLNLLDSFDIQSDLSSALRTLPIDNRIVVLFGIDFLNVYGFDINKVIDVLVNCSNDNNLFITTIFTKELVDKLMPFHDFYIEMSESRDTYISYRTYKASLRFSVKGGVAEISNVFTIDKEVNEDGGF